VLYAFVQDIAASWHQYEQVAGQLIVTDALGLIVHVAGATDDGIRIVEIWESESTWARFRDETQAATIAQLTALSRVEPSLRAVHGTHVVLAAPLLRQHRGGLE
jgi:hypothetical protein